MASEVRFLEREYAPEPLAEHLSYDVACAGLRHYGTKRSAKGLFLSAWYTAEFALSREAQIDTELRMTYIDYARDLLGSVLAQPDTHTDIRLGALVLSSYTACLQKRARGESILPSDCEQIYQSLGSAIRYLHPLDIHERPQWRMAETAVLAASARMRRPDLLMYPSSPREEASSTARFNHDGYFLADSSKLAIQQKLTPTNKEYDESITMLILEPILKRAHKKAGFDPDTPTPEQLAHTLSLIVAETHRQDLTSEEITLLNHLSSAVAHHRFAAARTTLAAAS